MLARPLHIGLVLVALHGGCILDECWQLRRRLYHAALPTDPPSQFQLERCAIDPAACVPICLQEMASQDSRFIEPVAIRRCEVVVDEDQLRVDVIYVDYACVGAGGDDVPPPNTDF